MSIHAAASPAFSTGIRAIPQDNNPENVHLVPRHQARGDAMPGDVSMPEPTNAEAFPFDKPAAKAAVEQGSRILSRVEGDIFDLIRDVGKLQAVADALLPVVGQTKAGEWRGRVVAVQGWLGQAAAEIYRLHAEGTAVALAKDIDVPQPRGGGPR